MCNYKDAHIVFLIGLVLPMFMSQISENWLCIKKKKNSLKFKWDGGERKEYAFLSNLNFNCTSAHNPIYNSVIATRLHK